MATSSRDTLSTGPTKEATDSHFSKEALAVTGSPNSEERVLDATPEQNSRWYQRKKLRLIVGLLAIFLVVLVICLPVFFIVVRKKHVATTSPRPRGGGGGGGTPNPGSPTGAVTGGNGSVITLANGTTFVYNNSFGGYWVEDPDDPYNNNARPNSWTPPLNTSWQWGQDRIYGVNLGGLFVLEPFITPDIFQRYPTAVDEYSLSVAMAADTANGGLSQLEDHYNTFITEQDIAEIAGSGLNFIRVPIPFWAIETWPGEPFLAKTSWKYFLRILDWARKYGLRVCLDLHTIPGSQNGYNHSGRLCPVNLLNGNMGIANAERALYYIRVLTEFISQPEYQNLIPIFGIINEPLLGLIGWPPMTSFYLQAHDMIRNITGYGEGHGPYIAIHDGFQPISDWAGFLEGSDRIILDGHNYFSFGGINPAPIDVIGPQGLPGGSWPTTACSNWGPMSNTSRETVGVYISGEFAASPNDCGFWLHGVGINSTNTQCPVWNDWASYSDDMKAGILNYVKASMDAFGDWFFWTWKVGPNSLSGNIETPLWTYQLGVRNGWIPTDPRQAVGMCQMIGTTPVIFNGSYAPWQTGTPSSIPASSSGSFPWPPPTISGINVPMQYLPTYTNTAPIVTLPPQTYTAAPASVTKPVDGWFNTMDTTGGTTNVSGCPYPDEWFGIFTVTPTAPCTGPT